MWVDAGNISDEFADASESYLVRVMKLSVSMKDLDTDAETNSVTDFVGQNLEKKKQKVGCLLRGWGRGRTEEGRGRCTVSKTPNTSRASHFMGVDETIWLSLNSHSNVGLSRGLD